MKDQSNKLSSMTVGLHWLLALAMIGMLAFGLILEDMAKGETKSFLMWWHKGLGVAVLAFALWRLGWRLTQGFPVPMSKVPAWQEITEKITHWFLLLGTLFMPLSGIAMSLGKNRPIDVFGLFAIPAFGENEFLHEAGEVIHGLGGNLLIAAIILHVVGAVKHRIVDNDGTMERMAGREVPNRQTA